MALGAKSDHSSREGAERYNRRGALPCALAL